MRRSRMSPMDFNNASVAAFVGAAFGGIFAVAAVVATDWLRDRRMVRTIRSEIGNARRHSTNKLEAVQNMLRLMREKNQILPGEILKFDVSVIREMKARVLHLLDPRQRQALDGVLFRMEGVDAHLDEVHRLQQEIRPVPGSMVVTAIRDNSVRRIDSLLSDIIVNLKVLVEMSDRYTAGDFATITQKRYLKSDYDEPEADQPTKPDQRESS